MAFIVRIASPINDVTYESQEAAIAAFIAPSWAGGPVKDITMIGDDAFRYRGDTYEIKEGNNPKLARRAVREAASKPTNFGSQSQSGDTHRSAFDANGKFKGSAWLSAEMDREDSSY